METPSVNEVRTIQTRVLRVDPDAPAAGPITEAAVILREGGLVAFPTETVYGLGANGLDALAVARIYEAKGRPPNNPIILHVADTEAAQALVSAWPETAARLAARFWPGPLTLVLPRAAAIPDIVTGGSPTVGIRVPAHPVALALLRAAQVPIAAPSANRSLQLSPTRAEHVLAGLNGRIALLLDGGPTTGGLESTVLNLTTKYPTLLRPGLISPAEIEAVVGPIKRRAPVATTEAALPAPGMLSRHYAPRAPLRIYPGDTWTPIMRLLDEGELVGWLTIHGKQRVEAFSRLRQQAVLVRHPFAAVNLNNLRLIEMPADPEAYAAALYDRLHALDAQNVTQIVVDAPPESEAWLAIRDRLLRAATKEQDRVE